MCTEALSRRDLILGAVAAAVSTKAFAVSKGTNAPIIVGLLYTDLSDLGVAILNAARQATEEINQGGGVNGRQIKLNIYNAKADPSEGVRVLRRAVEIDRADVILGVYSSSVAVALLPWAKRLNVPILVTSAATSDLTRLIGENIDQYGYMYRIGVSNSISIADAVCDFGRDVLKQEAKCEKAVILIEDQDWAKPYADRLSKKFTATSGIELVDYIRTPATTSDYTGIYSKIQASGADIILMGFAYAGLTPVAQWAQRKPTRYMAGVMSEAAGAGFYGKSNGAAEGLMTWTQGSDVPITNKTQTFVRDYKNRYKVDPLFTAFATYDGFYFYKQIVEQLGATESEAIVKALEGAEHVGAVGRIKLGSKGSEFPHDTIYGEGYVQGVIVQWQEGELKTIWPASVANRAIQKT